MMSALDTAATNRNSPFATFFIARVSSLSSGTSPRSSRRITAILVDTDNLAVPRARCSAAEGLTMACGASGWGAEVENENESPAKRDEEPGKATAVVTPER